MVRDKMSPCDLRLWIDFALIFVGAFILSQNLTKVKFYGAKEVRFVCLHNGPANLLGKCTMQG